MRRLRYLAEAVLFTLPNNAACLEIWAICQWLCHKQSSKQFLIVDDSAEGALNMASDVSKVEFALAVIAGLSLSLGLAPGAYWFYFDRFIWSHRYITHTGPWWVTLSGDLPCCGNLIFLGVFPIITFALVAKRLSIKHDFVSYVYLALPLAQILVGMFNLAMLMALLD